MSVLRKSDEAPVIEREEQSDGERAGVQPQRAGIADAGELSDAALITAIRDAQAAFVRALGAMQRSRARLRALIAAVRD